MYTDYIDDIIQVLRERESSRLRFNYISPQVEYRKLLVDFIRNLSDYRGFRRTTVFLGVYILDVFMDNHQIVLERLNLVATVCLLLAAKMEEIEAKVPKFAEIKRITTISYPINDCINLETMILRFFEWDLIIPTVMNFIEIYIETIITEADYQYHKKFVATIDRTYKNLAELKRDVAPIVFEFLDLILYKIKLLQEIPSRLAASIIAATRYVLYLEPVWSDNLVLITGYELSQLEDLTSELLRTRRKTIDPNSQEKRKAKTPDSGYISILELSDDSDDTENESDSPARKQPKLD